MTAAVRPYSPINILEEKRNDNFPLNRSGSLGRSDDIDLRAARTFSTSPKAEGDQLEQVRKQFKDITNQLEELEEQKILLLTSRIDFLVQLYRAKAPEAPKKIDLITQIQELLAHPTLKNCANRKLALFLYKLAGFAHHETISRDLCDDLTSRAAMMSKKLNLVKLSQEIQDLIAKNDSERKKIYEQIGPF